MYCDRTGSKTLWLLCQTRREENSKTVKLINLFLSIFCALIHFLRRRELPGSSCCIHAGSAGFSMCATSAAGIATTVTTDRLEGCGMQARQPLEGNLSGRLLYLPIVMHDQCCAEYFISCKQQFEDRPEVWVNISVAQSLAKQNKKNAHSVQEKGAHGGGCKMPHLWRLFPCAQQNVNVCRAWCSVGRGA